MRRWWKAPQGHGAHLIGTRIHPQTQGRLSLCRAAGPGGRQWPSSRQGGPCSGGFAGLSPLGPGTTSLPRPPLVGMPPGGVPSCRGLASPPCHSGPSSQAAFSQGSPPAPSLARHCLHFLYKVAQSRSFVGRLTGRPPAPTCSPTGV